MTVHVLRSSEVEQAHVANVDIPGQWQCSVCMRLCVGLRGNGATGVMLLVIIQTLTVPFADHWAGRHSQRVALCLRRGVQGRATDYSTTELGEWASAWGAGVGPISTADVVKKDEGGDLAQALSLLQKIMTPEDFVKKAEQENEGTGVV